MPPLKGTARNLYTIQFILTEHFYLLWYLFFLSLYSKAISQRPQVSCIFFDENKSDKNENAIFIYFLANKNIYTALWGQSIIISKFRKVRR